MITLMVFTHGRDEYLIKTALSAFDNLTGPITQVIVNDDKPDRTNLNHPFWSFPNVQSYTYLNSGGVGFAGAIRNAWNHFRTIPTPYVFHLEDDFIFTGKIDLWQMMGILDANAHLAQLSLMRQPWNEREKEFNSLYKMYPNDFENHKGSYPNGWIRMEGEDHWVEQDKWFTTNPCLYRGELVKAYEWPKCNHSEGVFTAKMREEGYRFGCLGTTNDGPRVIHIGVDRANGKGY